jgi:pimeloyl-ACP methyl ester carboxylesterase
LTAQERPDLFHAFVGTGQMVDVAATDRMFWEDTIAWADRTGDAAQALSLRELGPPPYDDPADYLAIVSAEHQWNAYPGVDELYEMPSNLFVPENSVMDIVGGIRGLVDAYAALYPQLQNIDFRQQVTSLDIPVTIVLGRHEARGRAVLVHEWFDMLDAPWKDLVIFEDSGHRPSFEQPGDFTSLMEEVLAATRS